MPVGKSFDEYRDAAIEREPALAEDLYDASVEVELGIALTRLRHLRGLTQRELADRCGIKQPMLVRIERGSQSPGVATLARILRALNGAVEVGPDGRVTAHAVSAEEGQKEEVHVDQGFADVRGNEPAAPAMGLGGMSAPGET